MPMAPSRFSGGRLSSFVPDSVSSPRTASRARTRESASRTGLSTAASIPTATASMSTASARTRPGERARMPPFTKLIDTREIVVAAPAVTPVVAPTMVPPRMRASGLNERTASFSTPTADRSCSTTPVVPAVATTPSRPPVSRRPMAVTSTAPRSIRTPVCVSLTATSRSSTAVPPIDDAGQLDGIERRGLQHEVRGGLLDGDPAPSASDGQAGPR